MLCTDRDIKFVWLSITSSSLNERHFGCSSSLFGHSRAQREEVRRRDSAVVAFEHFSTSSIEAPSGPLNSVETNYNNGNSGFETVNYCLNSQSRKLKQVRFFVIFDVKLSLSTAYTNG